MRATYVQFPVGAHKKTDFKKYRYRKFEPPSPWLTVFGIFGLSYILE